MGVYVHPEALGRRKMAGAVENRVRNDSFAPVAVTVNRVVNATGAVVASVSGDATVPLRDTMALAQEMTVQAPVLWDTEPPHLYTLRTRVLMDGKETDCTNTRFGFRTIRFDADEGFFLNGKPVKIKGVCCHQDYGLTGKAMPDRVHRYRLRRLKDMGANGYRTAHYPPAEATMDALDELGFLVMARPDFESPRMAWLSWKCCSTRPQPALVSVVRRMRIFSQKNRGIVSPKA